MNIKKGFTLLELLVVIAIIGILSSVVMINLNNSRAKARDAKLKQDLYSISLAMELYNSANGSYLNYAHWLNMGNTSTPSPLMIALVPTYLPAAPSDSVQTNTLFVRKDITVYGCNIGNSNKYALYAKLEKPSAGDIATLTSGDGYDTCIYNYGLGMNFKLGN